MRYLSMGILIVAVLVLALGCSTAPAQLGTSDPSAIVCALGVDPPRVVVLDAVTLEMVHRIQLSSVALQMAAANDALLLTAQCGGPGSKSDDRIGLVDPWAGTARYEQTNALDPEGISFSGSIGTAVHGEVRDGARMGTRIRLDSDGGVSLEMIELPHATTIAVSDGGGGTYLLESGPSGAEEESSPSESDRLWHLSASGVQTPVEMGLAGVSGIAVCGDYLAIARMESGVATVRLIESTSGAVLATRALGSFAHEPSTMHVAEGVLLVGEYSWDDPDDPGESVAALDLETLDELWVLNGLAGPCAITSTGGIAYIACRSSGEVVAVDQNTGRELGRSEAFEAGFDLMDVDAMAKSPADNSGQENRTR